MKCGRLPNVNCYRFYYGTPSENEQLFGARRKIPEYKFVAEVVAYDDTTQTATIRQRNVINEGDQVEFYGPGFRHFETYIEDLMTQKEIKSTVHQTQWNY